MVDGASDHSSDTGSMPHPDREHEIRTEARRHPPAQLSPAGMSGIRRLLESSLYCEDLGRSLSFYQELLGLVQLFRDDRLAALDAGGGTVLLLFRRTASADGVTTPGGFIPPHDGSGPVHLALAVDPDNLQLLEERLLAHGVSIESAIRWPRGGRSIYCRDPDGHSLELATPGVWPTY